MEKEHFAAKDKGHWILIGHKPNIRWDDVHIIEFKN